MTPEEILNKHDSSQKYIEQTCRPELFAAMDEYAKQQAIAFDEWRIENRWFSFEQGHYYHTFEHPTSMSDKEYNKNYVKTREQLYSQFIEQQNKNNDGK